MKRLVNARVVAAVADSNRKARLSLEERHRLNQGNDQLELWPTEKQPRWPFVVIFLALFLAVGLLFAPMVKASEVQFGTGIICDTQDQVEQVVRADLPRSHINVLNEEAGVAVCVVESVAFTVIEEYPPIEDALGNRHKVAKIVVLGLWVGENQVVPVPPMPGFTTFAVPKPPGIQV